MKSIKKLIARKKENDEHITINVLVWDSQKKERITYTKEVRGIKEYYFLNGEPQNKINWNEDYFNKMVWGRVMIHEFFGTLNITIWEG